MHILAKKVLYLLEYLDSHKKTHYTYVHYLHFEVSLR